MPFRTTLKVAHRQGKSWELTHPLVWEGQWQYLVVMTGFETDFASIPPPVRPLLDNAGDNAEAGVLHDAAWRESQRPSDVRRIDPWHADGLFRRALRETGATALSRGLMWTAVRLTAMWKRRWGHPPNVGLMVFQVVALVVAGGLLVAVPVVAAVLGIAVFWLATWVVALLWWAFDRYYLKTPTNWPWPVGRRREHTGPLVGEERELLLVVDKPQGPDGEPAPLAALEALLATNRSPTDEQVEQALAEAVLVEAS